MFNNIEQLVRINHTFKPTRPINTLSLFAGRRSQVEKIVNAITLPGAHVIVYGERGVGKTSLVSILSDTFQKAQQFIFIRVNCDTEQTFPALWRRVMSKITVMHKSPGMGFEVDTGEEVAFTAQDFLPNSHIDPDDVRQIFDNLDIHPVIILDEVDRIKDQAVIGRLADTIKSLSDHSTDATIIIVGVADSVDSLIGEHRSIERALVQIQLPRMSEDELLEALNKCLVEAGMTMADDAKDYIVLMSKGLPHYTHLLGLHAARFANHHDRTHIVQNDVGEAVNRAIDEIQQSVRAAYIRAIDTSQHDTLHKIVLLSCALAEPNELGYFTATDVKHEMSELLCRPVPIASFARHLTDFSSSKRGNILERTGTERQYRYRFTNPLMQPYVILKGVEMEIINYDGLNRLRQ